MPSFKIDNFDCYARDNVLDVLQFAEWSFGYVPQIELLGDDVIGDAPWSEVALFRHHGAYRSTHVGMIQVLGDCANLLAELLNRNLPDHDAYSRSTL